MKQLNLYLTEELQRDLEELMKNMGLKRKAEAIRQALREAVERRRGAEKAPALERIFGLGLKAPQNPAPRFRSDHDLW